MITQIIELAKTKNVREIAEETGASINSIRYTLRKNGVSTECGWQRDIETAHRIEKSARKYGQRITADSMGITVDQVKSAIKRIRAYQKKAKKFLTPVRIHRIRKSAITHALKMRLIPEEAEDFGSFCIFQIIAGSKQFNGNLFVNAMFSDYARQRLGRKGNRNYLKFEKRVDDLEAEDIIGSPPASDANDLWASLPKGPNGLILACVFRYDIPMKEIGVYMGVSESRISQVCTEAIRRLRREAA